MSAYELVHNPTTITTAVTAVVGNSASIWRIINLGRISGSGSRYGIELEAGGSVINGGSANTGASIGSAATEYGINLLQNLSTVTNFGAIHGQFAVFMSGGGIVTNGPSGAPHAAITGTRDGVYIKGGSGTVTNTGQITGSGLGVILNAGGKVANGSARAQGALISGGSGGVYVKSAVGAVTNSGTIDGNFAVYLGKGGSVANGSATATRSLIDGKNEGVDVRGASGMVTNSGTIVSDSHIAAVLYAGGTVVNQTTSAVISGVSGGVYIEGAAGAVTNLGAVSGNFAVFLDDGGAVTNGSAAARRALVSGGTEGVDIRGSTGSVTNSGTITSKSKIAVELYAGGTVVNGSTNALISGATGGVYIISAKAAVRNLGTITGGKYAVFLDGGGAVTNGGTASALIRGGTDGLLVQGVSSTITNFGTIAGGSKVGVVLPSGVVVNGGTGATKAAILGGIYGIQMVGTGTVKNYGTITGSGGTAVEFGGAGNLLVIEPGAVFRGAAGNLGIVSGGAGANAIELAGTALAVFTGLRMQFVNFDAVRIAPGADWQVDITPTEIAGETIAGNGGAAPLVLTAPGLFPLKAVSGFRLIEVENSGANTVTLTNSSFRQVSGDRITFEGGSGDDTVGANLLSGLGLVLDGKAGDDDFKLSSTTLSFSKISGGGGNDRLDLTGSGLIVVTAVEGVETISLASAAANLLTLTKSNFADVANRTITIEGGNKGNTVSVSNVAAADHVTMVGGGGTDLFTGGPGADLFQFSAGHLSSFDTVNGEAGADELMMTTAGTVQAGGVSGVETYVLADGAANSLALVTANFAGLAHPTITVDGGDSGNTLKDVQVAAKDTAVFIGGKGADTLVAGQHATMTGGAGADLFEFTTPGSTGSPDRNTVVDFGNGADKIALSNAGFRLRLPHAGATPKLLPAGLFAANANGHFTTAFQRFAYDTTHGKLYYDAAGDKVGSSRLLVASFNDHPSLTASKVFFVS